MIKGITKGKRQESVSLLVYGVEGVGKSTFSADAPNPIFIDGEHGTSELDVSRFPKPSTWQDVLDNIKSLSTEQHEFKTLVIDTLDWLEPLIWDYVCIRDHQPNIEEYMKGWGKGYVAALSEWRSFLDKLEYLRIKKEMNIVLLAHTQIKSFKNPEGDDFDRYELKLNGKAAALVKEWANAVFFVNFEVIAAQDLKKRVRGISTGCRYAYTSKSAAYDAKNRYSLPPMIPLSWEDFENSRKNKEPQINAIKEAIASISLSEENKKLTETLLGKAGNDLNLLNKLYSWVSTRTMKEEIKNDTTGQT
jgi:hypothetical protein